ncbi:MAG: ATP synthase F1 subunit gamma [Bacteroidetes bacterium]|nr:MAG: ATP synthase F1 subunit gamma [Bacteroidota bacterium]PTM20956.1 MAG: ATP synthase F1 subunit gamma [Bacteroidota bacterium]
MANLRDIRNRISSVNNTQQITKAMKMVAAAKLRKAQTRMISTRPFASKMNEVVGKLVSGDLSGQPLMRSSEVPKRVLVIVVGSDRGLCGAFNNNLFKVVEKEIQETLYTHQKNGTLELITIGKKATAYFKKRSYHIVQEVPGFFDRIEYEETSSLMNGVIQRFVAGEIDRVHIAYNEFKSVIAQNRIVKEVLPIRPENLLMEDSGKVETIDYLYENEPKQILNVLLPLYLVMELWRAVLESNASEQGARMAAMDSATENAKELEQELRLKYNQARQSAITTEISEIVSGAQALGN